MPSTSTWAGAMGTEAELILRPIGRVVKGRHRGERPEPDDTESVVEVYEAWAEALDGIDGFSHIWVIWWLDRSGRAPLSHRVHPEGRPEMPLLGLFATRSPRRPNPIAITAVRLLALEGARLRVQGLDAFEGTPVLDIKPYLRRGDLVSDAVVPGWLERLWRIHDIESGDAVGTS